jgi:hypothetical protein
VCAVVEHACYSAVLCAARALCAAGVIAITRATAATTAAAERATKISIRACGGDVGNDVARNKQLEQCRCAVVGVIRWPVNDACWVRVSHFFCVGEGNGTLCSIRMQTTTNNELSTNVFILSIVVTLGGLFALVLDHSQLHLLVGLERFDVERCRAACDRAARFLLRSAFALHQCFNSRSSICMPTRRTTQQAHHTRRWQQQQQQQQQQQHILFHRINNQCFCNWTDDVCVAFFDFDVVVCIGLLGVRLPLVATRQSIDLRLEMLVAATLPVFVSVRLDIFSVKFTQRIVIGLATSLRHKRAVQKERARTAVTRSPLHWPADASFWPHRDALSRYSHNSRDEPHSAHFSPLQQCPATACTRANTTQVHRQQEQSSW